MTIEKPQKNAKQPKQKALTKRLASARKKVSAGVAEDVSELLSLPGVERIEYNGAELYLVEKSSVVEKLLKIEKVGRKRVESYDIPPESADFSDVAVKLVNRMDMTANDAPASYYRLYMRQTPLILTDREKVFERLAGEAAIWANIQRRALREALAEGNFSEAEADRMRKETQERIDAEAQKISHIIEFYDEYEVILTNYEDAPYYPSIYYTDGNGKKQVSHLSIRTH